MSMVGIQDPLGETDEELKTTLSCSYKVVGSVLVLLEELYSSSYRKRTRGLSFKSIYLTFFQLNFQLF